jgi:hypothetical protein
MTSKRALALAALGGGAIIALYAYYAKRKKIPQPAIVVAHNFQREGAQ